MKNTITAIVITAVLLCSLPLSLLAQATPSVGTIYNYTLTSGATEYRISLGQGVKSFSIQLRGAYDLRLAFASGGTASNYWTIKTDSVATYYSPFIVWDGVIYLRCETAGQVAEIEYWK